MTPDQLIQTLEWRYATKMFDANRKIPANTWEALEKSLILSPSSFGMELWKFMVIEDRELRKKIRACSWGQSQVEDASHLVIFLSKSKVTESDVDAYLERNSHVTGKTIEELQGYKKVILNFLQTPMVESGEWMRRQIYLALGQFLASAACLEIDTCPMEGMDVVELNRVLGLENGEFQAVVMCTAGYRSPEDRFARFSKVRKRREEVIQTL